MRPFVAFEFETHTPPTRRTPLKRRNSGIHHRLRASVISIPELFTYAIYIVIAFVLVVFYLAITLLLVLLSISCWCT